MIITSGDNVALHGRTVAEQGDLAGRVIEDEVFGFTDLTFTIRGEMQSRVVQTASGTLDFYFRLRSLSSGTLTRASIGMQMTGPIGTDVDYRLDGLGDVGPTSAERYDVGVDGGITSAKVVAFTFGTPVQPGQSSRFVYVKTDHTFYTRYQSMGIEGSPTGSLPTGSPVWSTTLVAFAAGEMRI